MKNRHIWISATAILFFVFFILQSQREKPEAKDAKAYLALGNSYFNGSAGYNVAKAEEAFKKAVLADPKITYGHYQLARVYFIEKKNSEALSAINKELEINPENLRSLYVRGLIKAEIGDLSGAEDDFRRFAQWMPKEWSGWNDLSWILMKETKYKEAEAEVRSAFANAIGADTNPWLWNHLGLALLNQKKYGEAEKVFLRAKELVGKLTVKEWQAAYPGNNHKSAADGLGAFGRAVDFNLEQSRLK